MPGNGAHLTTLPFEVDMKFVGTLRVGFGRAATPIFDPIAWQSIRNEVEDLLLALEPFVKWGCDGSV
jgi:hypothetical protein